MTQNSKIKILIVDNQPNYTIGLRKGLMDAGYEIHLAENGDQALELVHEIQPDIILSEIQLPQLNGHELLKAIRSGEKFKNTPFFFLSNQKRVDERIKSISMQVDDYIQKPYYVDEVLARIELILKEIKPNGRYKNQNGFSGKLSEMNLVDLIQTLELGQKSGILTLERNSQTGEVHIQSGQVVNARLNSLSAEAALEKMMIWTDGVFEVQIVNITSQRQIHRENKEIIQNGLRKINQWLQAKAQLPPLTAVFQISIRIQPEMVRNLTPEERKIIQQIDGKKTLMDVIELIDSDEIETVKIIQDLFQKGFFTIREFRTEEHIYQKLQNVEYLEQIKQYTQRFRAASSRELALLALFLKKSKLAQHFFLNDSDNNQEKTEHLNHLNGSISKTKKYINKIHLTKSEIRMIREKLV